MTSTMNPTAPKTKTNSNLSNDNRRAVLKKELEALGKESVNTSKPAMALRIVRAAQEGVIGEDDAADTFAEYLAGRVKKVTDTNAGMLDDEGQGENKNSKKANVSKNKQLLKAAGLFLTDAKVDFLDVLNRAVTLRGADVKTGVDVKPPFDCFVDLAREQMKNPTAALDDEQITKKIRKSEGAGPKDFGQLLLGDLSRLSKRRDDSANETENQQPMPALDAIVEALKELLGELGVEIPKSKDEKAEEEALAFLAKRGHKVTIQ